MLYDGGSEYSWIDFLLSGSLGLTMDKTLRYQARIKSFTCITTTRFFELLYHSHAFFDVPRGEILHHQKPNYSVKNPLNLLNSSNRSNLVEILWGGAPENPAHREWWGKNRRTKMIGNARESKCTEYYWIRHCALHFRYSNIYRLVSIRVLQIMIH